MRQVVKSANGAPTLGKALSVTVKMDNDCDHTPDHRYTGGEQEGVSNHLEKERRLRREIANSNERRRMQSINLGYQSLRNMLPVQREGNGSGEKLSKAAVLQHAVEHIERLRTDCDKLVARNNELTALLNKSDSVAAKRRKRDTESSSDEGISMTFQHTDSSSSEMLDELRREVAELRVQLERERQGRALMEQSYTYLMAATRPSAATASVPPQLPQVSPSLAPQLAPLSLAGSQQVESSATNQPEHEPSAERPIEPAAPYSEFPTSFGKASSVASQNLSIIVEAINHLEGDRITSSDKEDSAVSLTDSDMSKSNSCSRVQSPQPPPAHQSAPSTHPAVYFSPYPESLAQTAHSPPLMYRPTFLSGFASNLSSPRKL